ncbi:hypothetical protein Tco_1465873 [Tanacetum coccineum]
MAASDYGKSVVDESQKGKSMMPVDEEMYGKKVTPLAEEIMKHYEVSKPLLRAQRLREEFEWKRSLFEIDFMFGINAFALEKGIEVMKDMVIQEHMCEEERIDDHVPDEIDGAKGEQVPNHVGKKGNLEFLVCKQVTNHGGDELVDKGRPLKKKRVYAE